MKKMASNKKKVRIWWLQQLHYNSIPNKAAASSSAVKAGTLIIPHLSQLAQIQTLGWSSIIIIISYASRFRDSFCCSFFVTRFHPVGIKPKY